MWQKELKHSINSASTLAKLLKLIVMPGNAERGLKTWPVKVPQCWLRRIKRNCLQDPLLKQVLPSPAELRRVVGFTLDPLGEKKYLVAPGVLHKYYGRVLLLVTDTCALNCRFCFRRYCRERRRINWSQALRYIASNPTITEVILSGGDPLTLSDATLKKYIQKIAAIKHVRYLRIHTRVPIVLPSRITKKLLQILTHTRLMTVMVVHCNHAQEIDRSVQRALLRSKNAGINLFNQAVLLREINDDAAILIELSRALFTAGVLPYYLHILDKVQGASHFYVTPSRAKEIHATIARKLPGYLVPRLVIEIIGAAAKTDV